MALLSQAAAEIIAALRVRTYNASMGGPPEISVHPTAVVSAKAELHRSVQVGPYAVIEAGAQLGEGVQIGPHAVVKANTVLQAHCRLHTGAVIGDDPQDLSFSPETPSRVIVGEHTVVREYATIHRATVEDGATRIGSHSLLMGASHIAHDAVIGDHVTVCNSALIAGHVQIHDRAFISGNTAIHQFCRVGELVMLSGMSGIGLDVGPYLTISQRTQVSGFNTVGMRRANISGEVRSEIKKAYRMLFESRSLEEGLQAVSDAYPTPAPELSRVLEFYRKSTRGFARP